MDPTKDNHFLAGKSIIVVGAGIGGLTFCIALEHLIKKGQRKINPPPQIVIYERDESRDAINRQGYSLSIRSDPLSGGMQMLHRLGMLDELIAASNTDDHFTIFNNDFTPLIDFWSPPIEDLPKSSLRILRSKLRELMASKIDPTIRIEFNCGVQSAEDIDGTKCFVTLMNGRQETCDLLIVADGANSKIRRALRPENKLQFAGAVSISAGTHELDVIPFPIDSTSCGVIGNDGHFAFLAQNNQRSTIWSISYLADVPRQTKQSGTLSETEIDDLLAEATERANSFAEPVPTLIKGTMRDSISVMNANDLVPFRNQGTVIFIDDAQHAMSPFAGNGANMAIMDGYQLAEQLISKNSLSDAIRAYEDLSISRSMTVIDMSHRAINIGHSQGVWKYLWVIGLKIFGWFFAYNRRRMAQPKLNILSDKDL